MQLIIKMYLVMFSQTLVYLADPLSLYHHSDLKVTYKLPYLVTGGLGVLYYF
jgi:hypothetical protein